MYRLMPTCRARLFTVKAFPATGVPGFYLAQAWLFYKEMTGVTFS
jgi:hypothetical protein